MNGRILSEQMICQLEQSVENEMVRDLIATVRNIQEQTNANASLWEEALAEKQREIEERNKLLCIEKKSVRSLALMVDCAKEAIADRDKTIAELRKARDSWRNETSFHVQQNTILRESILKARGAGYNEDCIFCGIKDRMMDDALVKVNNV